MYLSRLLILGEIDKTTRNFNNSFCCVYFVMQRWNETILLYYKKKDPENGRDPSIINSASLISLQKH